MAVLCRLEQRHSAEAIRQRRVGARLQQQLAHADVALAGRDVQRGALVRHARRVGRHALAQHNFDLKDVALGHIVVHARGARDVELLVVLLHGEVRGAHQPGTRQLRRRQLRQQQVGARRAQHRLAQQHARDVEAVGPAQVRELLPHAALHVGHHRLEHQAPRDGVHVQQARERRARDLDRAHHAACHDRLLARRLGEKRRLAKRLARAALLKVDLLCIAQRRQQRHAMCRAQHGTQHELGLLGILALQRFYLLSRLRATAGGCALKPGCHRRRVPCLLHGRGARVYRQACVLRHQARRLVLHQLGVALEHVVLAGLARVLGVQQELVDAATHLGARRDGEDGRAWLLVVGV
mmetsp:Transcript_39203/g.116619  ORF Transcript_39203/g.116619 Transcript_39203/m.116619 type:complete len:352 (+) Transcript_39203:402-1457(+)